MAHYVIFYKIGDLDLDRNPDFDWKMLPGFSDQSSSAVKISEWSDKYCVEPSRTDKQTNTQTNRQTDRGDQYTLQKSTILQSNERALRESVLCQIAFLEIALLILIMY